MVKVVIGKAGESCVVGSGGRQGGMDRQASERKLKVKDAWCLGWGGEREGKEMPVEKGRCSKWKPVEGDERRVDGEG